MNILFYCLTAFIISLLVSLVSLHRILKLCHRYKLYDLPNARKVHKSGVPRLGGAAFLPALLCAFFITIAIMRNVEGTYVESVHFSTLFIGSGVLFVYMIGVIDDLFSCSAIMKFIIESIAALIFVSSGLYLDSLFGFCGVDMLPLWVAYPLSIFFTLLITNAYNLIDGIDGLSSSLSVVALAVYTYYFAGMNLPVFCIVSVSLIASLLVFLPYNLWGNAERGTKTFMGDSGSLFLGITLSYFTLKLSQKNGTVTITEPNGLLVSFSVILVPCFDLCRVAMCRIMHGHSIFTPDKTHIHHKFMAKGFGMHPTAAIIVGIQCFFLILNLSLAYWGSGMEFIIGLDVVIYTLLHVWLPNPTDIPHESISTPASQSGARVVGGTRRRILHVSKYYPPYVGGIEDVCKNIVENIPEHEQMVFCFNTTASNVDEVVNGIHVIRIGLWREIARQPLSWHYSSMFRRILHNYKPDVVHLHAPNPFSSVFCLLHVKSSTKLVIHWHSDIVVNPVLHALFSPLERLLLHRADVIIATSPNYIEGSELLRQHRDKCRIVPNTIIKEKLDGNYEPCKVEEIKRKYGKFVFFLGRHVTYKGIEYLIDAAREMGPDTNFVIAGKGPLTQSLIDRSAGLTNVNFVGRIPDEELSNYMSACSVFAFPSITKNEAFGVVLAEAMYCGAVPVSFNIDGSGVNWVSINNETGIVVPNSDVKAYVEALRKLLDDESLRRKYSAAAHKRVVDMFMPECIRPTLLNIYES